MRMSLAPSNREVNEAVEKIYSNCYQKYISPSEYEKMASKGYHFDEWNFRMTHLEVKKKIEDLLRRGNFVKSGYMATSIREYHDRYIIWKP